MRKVPGWHICPEVSCGTLHHLHALCRALLTSNHCRCRYCEQVTTKAAVQGRLPVQILLAHLCLMNMDIHCRIALSAISESPYHLQADV